MNYNNLSQLSNYSAGSDALPTLPFYLTQVNIPGLQFSHIDMGSRSGTRWVNTGDTITYNALSFEMLIDEDFLIYQEFMTKITQNLNPEDGTYAPIQFDFWIEITNNKGNKLFKMDFYNCRVESIADIQLNAQEDTTEFTMSVDLRYDYYKINNDASLVPKLITS